MSIKKYSSGSWVTVPYRKYETATDTITSLPKTIIGDGQPISSYTIKGNMVQSGTPTPSNPIYPQEVGDLVTTGEHAGEYEIPILSNGVSYPIYLSEPIRKKDSYVDTAPSSGTASRVIKKLVLDGSEPYQWRHSSTRLYSWYLLTTDLGATTNTPFLCTHGATVTSVSDYAYGTVYCDNTLNIGIFPDNLNWESEVKLWLATQAENGTPVIIWYILATATTETFTAPTIPTSGTAQTFDVDTTLKPSEISLTWHGWHEHEDTKYTSG